MHTVLSEDWYFCVSRICPVFEEDIYEAISLKTCVNKRLTIGAPGHDAMAQVIKICQDYLSAYEDGVSE